MQKIAEDVPLPAAADDAEQDGAAAVQLPPEAALAAAGEAADDSVAADAAVAPAALPQQLELILEALLLAADLPLSAEQLQRLVGAEFKLSRRELREVLERMQARYAASACELCEVASGWRLQVRADYGTWVGRLWQEKPPRYSRALLETLALIVYRQPITRGEIEDVRGVAVSTNILRTLLERGWVREVGHKEVPGRPALYGTTPQFLDDFNLKSLDQLPSLPQVQDLEQIEAALARAGQGLVREPIAGEDGAKPAADSDPIEPDVQVPPPSAVVH